MKILSFLLCLSFISYPFALTASTGEKFDLEAWKKGRGTSTPLKNWQKQNPSPWRSYFNPTSEDCAKRWYVNLGPLGVRTLMHDRSWGVFEACRKIQPVALTDEHGLIWNTFEILGVKKGSPAEGRLLPGDLILGMDNQLLMGSQHVFPARPLDNRSKRGLEMHAGQLIDQAEGRGEIQLHVLRLPKTHAMQQLTGLRKWTKVGDYTLKAKQDVHLSVRLGKSSLCRLRRGPGRGRIQCDGLFLKGAAGETVRIELPSKRGAGSLIGDILEIPAGDWTLEGRLNAARDSTLTVETLNTPAIPTPLKNNIQTVSLPLDAIGSFGEHFDPEGEKARNYAAMLAHRLAVQQEDDGSWNAGGYASLAFHTSVCGLALLSTDDPAYMEAVRKAACYVAMHGEFDKWTYSNGLWLVFLSEYYLRTRDLNVLPAMRMQVRNLRRFVLSDYTAGHSYGKPGYGGSGWIGGGGVVALALAVAANTPAMESDDLALLDRMLARAQEIAPHGRIPYGRSGKVKSHDAMAGQGGSCATGPYFIASLLRGGAPLFTQNGIKRYSTPPYGSAENGHATQTLHFVWGCLSVANTTDEAHRAHLRDYLWKFTTYRESDGFINKNNFRTEYHNGDGVIGEPYWRTAGYVLVMNAHKRNLAITGKPEFRNKVRDMPVVYHRDRATHNQALRNWSLVEAVLGNRAPASFHRTMKRLRALASGPDLGHRLRTLLLADVPAVTADLLALKTDPKGISRAQLAQLLLGHAFEASFSSSTEMISDDESLGAGANSTKLSKKEQKAAAKELAQRIKKGQVDSIAHALTIRPVSMIQKDPEARGGDMSIKGALFPMEKLLIELTDRKSTFLKAPLVYDPSSGKDSLTALREYKLTGHGELEVRVSYRSAGVDIAYTTNMQIPSPIQRGYVPFLTQVPVEGSVLEDYSDSYSMRILLDSGAVIGCEQRNRPAPYLLAGGRYRFWISANTGGWGHDLRRVEDLTPAYRTASVTRVSGVPTSAALWDADPQTSVVVTGGIALICELEEPTDVSSVFLTYAPGERKIPYTVEAWVDEKWQLMRHASTATLLPVIPARTSRIRVSFPEKAKGHLSELRFITPAPASPTTPRFSW